MPKWIAGVALLLLSACATPDLPPISEDGDALLGEGASKRLKACYVVLGWGEMLYTDSYFFQPRRAVEDLRKLTIAADRIRDWPESKDWGDTEARYATITISIVLGRSARDEIFDVLGRGLSIRTFLRIAAEGAAKGAVIDAYVNDINRQRDDPTHTDETRIQSCIDRLELVEDRIKDINGIAE